MDLGIFPFVILQTYMQLLNRAKSSAPFLKLPLVPYIVCEYGTDLFILEAYAAQPYICLAVVGKGRSSPLNHMVHFGSFRPSKNWQGDNFTQFCIVSKGKCSIVVPTQRGNSTKAQAPPVWSLLRRHCTQ